MDREEPKLEYYYDEFGYKATRWVLNGTKISTAEATRMLLGDDEDTPPSNRRLLLTLKR